MTDARLTTDGGGAVDAGRTLAGLWAGVIGPVAFVAVFLVEGLIRPGYDAMRLQVSYLSLGEGGWVQVLSFLVCGGLVVAFASRSGTSWAGEPDRRSGRSGSASPAPG